MGIYVEQEDGSRVQNVSLDTPTVEVERKIRDAIDRHFRFKLQRPELLNRIGDNIIVFDFIRPEVASSIFAKMLSNVIGRVKDEHGLTIEIADEVRGRLLALCASDLSNGGRGIGNQLETVLINPLARALFDRTAPPGNRVVVSGHSERDGIHTLELT